MVTMRILGANALSSFWEVILTFFWVGCWFVALALLVSPLASTLFPDGPTRCEFPIRLDHGPRHELKGTGGTWSVTPTQAQLVTPHARTNIASWIMAVFLALGAYLLGLLRNVFGSVGQGSPFIAANARRLRRMGLTVLVIEALRILVTMTVIAPVVESLEPVEGQPLQVDLWPSWSMVFIACVFFILAEVFRRGTAMQDEQEHTA